MDIRSSLEASYAAVTERVGDPTSYVYADFFAEHPQTEALFARDNRGSIRGHMLSEVLSGLLDLAEGKAYARFLFRNERVTHQEFGIEAELYPVFFGSLKQSFQRLCAEGWTADMERAWEAVLAEVDRVLAEAP